MVSAISWPEGFLHALQGYWKTKVNKQIAKVCEEWCTERDLIQKLQMSFDSVMERFNELNPQTRLKFRVRLCSRKNRFSCMWMPI